MHKSKRRLSISILPQETFKGFQKTTVETVTRDRDALKDTEVRRNKECGALAVFAPERSPAGHHRPWQVVHANPGICREHFPTQWLSTADLSDWKVLG